MSNQSTLERSVEAALGRQRRRPAWDGTLRVIRRGAARAPSAYVFANEVEEGRELGRHQPRCAVVGVKREGFVATIRPSGRAVDRSQEIGKDGARLERIAARCPCRPQPVARGLDRTDPRAVMPAWNLACC